MSLIPPISVRKVGPLAAHKLAAAHGAKTVFSDVTLAVAPGELLLIVGPNGAGKTTLLRLLAGLDRPQQGAVELAGVPLAHMSPRERAKTLGVLFDAPDSTFAFTAYELVLMGRFPHLGRFEFEAPDDHARAVKALADVHLSELANRPYPTLSSGEKQRVGLARLLCQDTPYLLLDEPTSRLDPAYADLVIALLRVRCAAGCGLVVVMHDLDLAARFAALDGRVAVLSECQIIAHGRASDVFTPALIERVWGVTARRVDGGATGRVSLVFDGPA